MHYLQLITIYLSSPSGAPLSTTTPKSTCFWPVQLLVIIADLYQGWTNPSLNFFNDTVLITVMCVCFATKQWESLNNLQYYNVSYTDYWHCIWAHIHGLCSYKHEALDSGLYIIVEYPDVLLVWCVWILSVLIQIKRNCETLLLGLYLSLQILSVTTVVMNLTWTPSCTAGSGETRHWY